MKTLFITILTVLSAITGSIPNKAVDNVDLKKFAGTWYSLYSIPTKYDKGSRETITRYTLNKQGYYNVLTTCKESEGNSKSVKSKLFPEKSTNDSEMKAQFIWPLKVDYWVVDLSPDYSWAVVGHPDYRFLFILSRKPEMSKELYQKIVAHCKAMGYPVSELVSQKFPNQLK